MSQSAGDRSSNTHLSNGVEQDAATGSATEQNSGISTHDQASLPATSDLQPGQQSESTQDTQSDSSEVRADRLLRLVLAILRGGSDSSASSLVQAIRQNAREGSDEVDLRGVAESALRIFRDDPGVQEELEIVEALLEEFHEHTIYGRFPL